MKRVFKEFDKTLYSVDIMFYSIMTLIGYFLVNSDTNFIIITGPIATQIS